jgi:glycine oxidase
MQVTVLGAGVAGLCAATTFLEAGFDVTVQDRDADPRGASWLAGGMLAPGCEADGAPPDVIARAAGSADWWAARVPGVERRGTIALAAPRDRAELSRFAARTTGHETLTAPDIAALEPDLAGRFTTALYYKDEAHLCPRTALAALTTRIREMGGRFRFGCTDTAQGAVIDCRGIAARDRIPNLRAVRGEMAILRSPDLAISRTIRLLHPRFPLYIVARGMGIYMIGASMIESSDPRPITARTLMELLSAAYTLHPAFAEASVIETGTGLRPAYADNRPRVTRAGDTLQINGLYRHGFLLAPALAAEALALFTESKASPCALT